MRRVLGGLAALALSVGLIAVPAQAQDPAPALFGRWEPTVVPLYTRRDLGNWQLDQAIAAWNAVGVVQIVRVAEKPAVGITVRKAIPEKMNGWAGAATIFAGDGQMQTCGVLLTRGMPRWYKPFVTVHELGHCLGLPDNYAPDSVMAYATAGSVMAPTATDVATLQAYYAQPLPENFGQPTQEAYKEVHQ